MLVVIVINLIVVIFFISLVDSQTSPFGPRQIVNIARQHLKLN
jgi:hypothetical protein